MASSRWYKRWFKKSNKQKPMSQHVGETNIILSGVKVSLRCVSDALEGVPAPGLQGAIKGILFIMDNMDRATQNLSDFRELGESLASYERLFDSYKSEKLPTALKEAMTTLTKNIREPCKVINRIVDHCRVRRILESSEDAQLFIRQLRVIDDALHRFQTATLSYITLTTSESLEISQRLLLDNLPVEEGAYYNSSDREMVSSSCLKNTRVRIRKQITDWIFDEDAPPIFWLRGMAGTGKSAVAQSIAEYCQNEGHLAGHFFFSRDILTRHSRSGAKFFNTLASQLCDFDVRLVPHLVKSFLAHPSVAKACMKDKFSALLVQPLSALDSSVSLLFPMVVVVDALDECQSQDDAVNILSLLFSNPLQDRSRPLLKFLITSRPEPHISEAFSQIPEPKARVFMECNLDEEDVHSDIEAYLKNGFEIIYASRPKYFQSRRPPWPDPYALKTLSKRSNGLFIYASTILKFVGDKRQHPVKQLRIVLDIDPGNQADIYNGLDRLYRQTIAQDPCLERARAVVGTIILVATPLSVKELEVLLELEEGEAHVTLQWLQSVLIIPPNDEEQVRLFHRSFHDFMTTQARSGDLYIDPEEHHGRLACACTKVIETGWPAWKLNPAQSSRLSVLRYACCSWSYHLSRANLSNAHTIVATTTFLRSSIRLWFDAMINLGLLKDLLPSIMEIFRSTLPTLDPELSRFLCQEMDHLGFLLSTQYEFLRYIDPLQIAENLHEQVVGCSQDISHIYRYHLGLVKRKVYQCLRYRQSLDEALEQLNLALNDLSDEHEDRALILIEKAICHRLYRQPSGIQESVSLFQAALSSMPDDDPNKAAGYNSYALTLISRFEKSGDPVDLDGAIEQYKGALGLTPAGQSASRGIFMNNLGSALRLRFQQKKHADDILEAIQLTAAASDDPMSSPSLSFKAAYNHAKCKQLLSSGPSLPIYLDALTKARRICWSALRDDVARRLIKDAEMCAHEATAEAITEDRPEIALECVEQACSTFWMGGLNIRKPFSPLGPDAPEACKLAERLEVGGSEEPAGILPADRLTCHPFGDRAALVQAHRLLVDREGSLSTTTDAGILGNLVVSLPTNSIIIFLNATHHRCDALILKPDPLYISPVRLPISLATLQSIVVDTKGLWNPGFRRPERNGRQISQFLWDYVVQPIVNALEMRPKDDLPRVWWCLTGLFSDLPIHAAANYNCQPPDFATNYMISSYISSLNRFNHNFGRWKNVSDQTTDGVRLIFFDVSEGSWEKRRDCEFDKVKALIPDGQLLAMRDGSFSLKYITEQLRKSAGIHVASRAEQRNEDASECRFVLPGETYLQLQHFRDDPALPQFTYLSTYPTTAAWATGTVTCRLGYDLFNVGFSSVVAQQSPMSEEEAALMATRFYTELLNLGKLDFRNAAKALHLASIKLRESEPLDQMKVWARYIHIGI